MCLGLSVNQIANLSALLPSHGDEQNALTFNIYSYKNIATGILKINVDSLREKIKQDESLLLKLWKELCYRYIIIYGLVQFKEISFESLRHLCNLCTIKIYKRGDKVFGNSGGVLLQGMLSAVQGEGNNA